MIDQATLLNLLGPFPAHVPLQAHVLESVDCGSYLREKVTYCTERDERISAYVCIPKHLSLKAPAVYCHHQHNFDFTLGKSEVVGLAGDPDQAYASELAQRGFITFAPDAIAFEEGTGAEAPSKPNTTNSRHAWYGVKRFLQRPCTMPP